MPAKATNLKMSIMRIWYRLIHMDDSRLTKQAFNFDYESGKNNWCTDVEISLIKPNIIL